MKVNRVLFLGGVFLLFLTASVLPQASAKDGVYEVVYPLGVSKQEVRALSPHLPDLNGKTICGSGHSYEGDEAVREIVNLLKGQYPDLKFIPNTEFPEDVSTDKQIAAFQTMLRQKGCDAVISGIGC